MLFWSGQLKRTDPWTELNLTRADAKVAFQFIDPYGRYCHSFLQFNITCLHLLISGKDYQEGAASAMTEMSLLSSPDRQTGHYGAMSDQENIDSSPVHRDGNNQIMLSGAKPRRAPTVTPKRFRKFFTPRSSLSSRGGRQSKVARQLQDITKNGANLRRHDPLADHDSSEKIQAGVTLFRPIKRRRFSQDLCSSPPQSSPLKHVEPANELDVLTEIPVSPPASEADSLPTVLDVQIFPQPIRRANQFGSSRHVLERSFGDYDALSRGYRRNNSVVNHQANTAHFVTTPKDMFEFDGTSLPFCTIACNTNSLVAIGEEEGTVRIIDSSPSSDFNSTWVSFRPHHNAVMDMAFSSDDYLLATASGDQSARVVDMHTQQTTTMLCSHISSVKQVRFYPNNEKMMTTSSRDGTVQLWDLRMACDIPAQVLNSSIGLLLENENGSTPKACTSKAKLDVITAHTSSKRSISDNARKELSITSLQHLPHGREHLILTASEASASIKLWDLRSAGRRRVIPVSSTPVPDIHRRTRDYGINSLVLSGDGSRVYAVCRDASIYAYSSNHLALGCVPEMFPSDTRHRLLKQSTNGLAPLYSFKHPLFKLGSFYIKAALRPAKGDQCEMLAVGSTEQCPILMPTDERNHLHHRRAGQSELHSMDANDADLPDLPPKSSQTSACSTANAHSDIPVIQNGTPLIRGHEREVTSLTWTHNGDLVSVGDDFSARCWRKDPEKARELRSVGEAGGKRWRHGWACVDLSWDEEEC